MAEKKDDGATAVLATADMQRDAAMARGVEESAVDDNMKNCFWVVSNRVDDVVVLWEQDRRHPGGEAFIGGGVPDYVYKTPAVDKAVYDGLAVKVDAPAAMLTNAVTGEEYMNPLLMLSEPERGDTARALPGQPILLGRKLDTKFWSDAQIDKVGKKQAEGRQMIPVDPETIVPTDNPRERRT